LEEDDSDYHVGIRTDRGPIPPSANDLLAGFDSEGSGGKANVIGDSKPKQGGGFRGKYDFTRMPDNVFDGLVKLNPSQYTFTRMPDTVFDGLFPSDPSPQNDRSILFPDGGEGEGVYLPDTDKEYEPGDDRRGGRRKYKTNGDDWRYEGFGMPVEGEWGHGVEKEQVWRGQKSRWGERDPYSIIPLTQQQRDALNQLYNMYGVLNIDVNGNEVPVGTPGSRLMSPDGIEYDLGMLDPDDLSAGRGGGGGGK
jgi:hypothetical protein